jgi:DNA-binding NarL/FixJ family response regulator
VIVLSSSSQASDIARCYDLGANSYLVKPLEFGEFTQLASDVSRYWLELNQDAQQGMLSP